MTKTQVKARATKLLEKLSWDLYAEFDDLRIEVEEERDSVEPYENKSELTPQQEERVEWLDNVAYALQQLLYVIEENAEEIIELLAQ